MQTADQTRPDITVIVPAYNAEAVLGACLDALLKQTTNEPGEIIVVDDGSTDRTAEVAERYGARVKLLRQANRGPAAARNAGIEAASGSILLFTDADCAPVEDWASTLTRALRAGADGVKGTYRTRQRSIIARFVQAEYESKYRRMAVLPRIDFIDTYSAGYRRLAIEGAGCFNEELKVDEDQELSFRMAERGYELRFVPEATVFHRHVDHPWAYLRRKHLIGYWKVRVAALHPERIVSDSHTPPSIKLQMLLVAIALVCLPLGLFWRGPRRALVSCAVAFLGTTLPFVRQQWPRDRGVALVAPALMLLRTLGLLWGVAAGLGSGGRQLIERTLYQGLKRVIDICLSLLMLLLTAPLMPFIALAIKFDSRGPVLFAQWRVGRGGKPFLMYKFRTMVDGAAEMRSGLAEQAARHSGSAGPVLKLQPDPRVTRVGRFLRRWSIDELPQLINVIKGEMSLVGPRPEEIDIVRQYSPWHRQRLSATPGVSGPMQVNGRGGLSLDERVRLELRYIEKPSLLEDARILARTVGVVLSGDGAV